jgi:tetratricopeptide (TPR) repeat protein
MSLPSLAAVAAYARTGALSHAWRLFRDGGFDRVADDPAVLAVRGRLLKGEARGAAAEGERRRLYREAGAAYAQAGALQRSTYPLINAATLAFLAGDRDEAAVRAEAVLAQGDDPDETPYYQAATRAEALLLLGRTAEARAALETAVARAPRAWEDHASTLRQFRLILAEAGEPGGWADMLRPPRCLHYAGHMAPADPDALARDVEALLYEEAPGFGFGALAAGADLVIAEVLLARGAELHVVLPAGRAAFAGRRWGPPGARASSARSSRRRASGSPAPTPRRALST